MLNILNTKKANNKYLFVINGESNAGGLGLNSSGSVGELGIRSNVRIMNNYTLNFEILNIGSNNYSNHADADITNNPSRPLPDPTITTTRHGFELQLANIIDSNTTFYKSETYIIKTGQGTSLISEWMPSASNRWLVTSFFTQFTDRINSAKSYFDTNNLTYTPVIIFSLGINDVLGNTNVNTWKSNVLTHFANMRSLLEANTPIIITQFQSMTDISVANLVNYNIAIQEICSEYNNIYCIDTTGFALGDIYHWNYTGLKQIVNKMKPIFDNF